MTEEKDPCREGVQPRVELTIFLQTKLHFKQSALLSFSVWIPASAGELCFLPADGSRSVKELESEREKERKNGRKRERKKKRQEKEKEKKDMRKKKEWEKHVFL